MLGHAGFRPLWPVIVFVPWFYLGLALLLRAVHKSPISVVHRRASAIREERRPLLPRGHQFRGISIWALACVAAAHVAIADPAAESPRACEVKSPREAGALADKLFERGAYQRAGACYQAAGDMVHANLAFLKAVGPESEDTARALKSQGEAAKSLFATVGQAFRADR
jgi:hypothetical protein